MQSSLRSLGYLCYIAATGCVILAVLSRVSVLLTAAGLVISGVVLFALATILDRIESIELLLKSSSMISADRVKTDVGDFEKLGSVEGEAMCTGCRRTVPKADLYYNKAMDVYYHPECLARDRAK